MGFIVSRKSRVKLEFPYMLSIQSCATRRSNPLNSSLTLIFSLNSSLTLIFSNFLSITYRSRSDFKAQLPPCPFETVASMDAGLETTGMYSRRVLKGHGGS